MRTNNYNLIKHSKSDSVAIIFVEQILQVFSKVQRTAISLIFRCAAPSLFNATNIMVRRTFSLLFNSYSKNCCLPEAGFGTIYQFIKFFIINE